MQMGIWYFSLRVLKCFFLMVDLMSFTVHNGRRMNCLKPSGPMMNWEGGSALTISLLFESPFDPSTSLSSSPSADGELEDGTRSS